MSFIFCLLLSVAQAGYLRIVGEMHLQIHSEKRTAVLSGNYQIKNDGDETAYQVQPEIRIDGFQWKGTVSDLAAGEGARWDLEEKIKELTLPVEGDYLLKIRKFYQDSNGYKFGVPDVSLLRTAKAVVQKKSLQLHLKVTKDRDFEQKFRAHYTLKNISDAPLEVKLDFLLPDEVRISTQPGVWVLDPREVRIGEIEFFNEKGLPGSTYTTFLTAEWSENGQRRGDFVNQTFQIPQIQKSSKWTLDQAFLAWWLWSMIIGMIGLWVFWIRPLRNYSGKD